MTKLIYKAFFAFLLLTTSASAKRGPVKIGTSGAHANISWAQTCQDLYQEMRERNRTDLSHLPTTWNSRSFSDPNNHNPKQFTYLFHTLSGNPAQVIQRKFDLDIGTTRSPIFASLITEKTLDKTFWRNRSGFILEFAEDNLIGTSCVDSYALLFNITREEKEKRFELYRQKFGLDSPQQLFLSSLWSNYYNFEQLQDRYFSILTPNNEVLLRGVGTKGTVVRIAAVYVFQKDAPELKKYLIDFAHNNNLKIIGF